MRDVNFQLTPAQFERRLFWVKYCVRILAGDPTPERYGLDLKRAKQWLHTHGPRAYLRGKIVSIKHVESSWPTIKSRT